MKIVIFGATGKVGRNVTAEALEQGYEVTAFVRNPAANLGSDPNLKVHVGDVLNVNDVKKAVAGHDAVIVALGMPIRNKDGLREKGTAHVISAMQTEGVSRLICLSGLGAGDSFAMLPKLYRYFILPVILKHVYADHEKQEALVKNSGLDWTLVRPSNYFEGPKTGHYKYGFDQLPDGTKLKISYKDVADFMVRQIRERAFLRAAATLST